MLTVCCPPLDQPVFVDRDIWEKVVLNLLSNALKFTFEGEITVSIRQTGGIAELVIRDTGTGVPAAEMPRLFERFYWVENAKARTHEGRGIGLALVQELLKLHGGSITAESILGTGTTFSACAPLGSGYLPARCPRAGPRHGCRFGRRRTVTRPRRSHACASAAMGRGHRACGCGAMRWHAAGSAEACGLLLPLRVHERVVGVVRNSRPRKNTDCGRPLPKHSTSSYTPRTSHLLRRPVESGKSAPVVSALEHGFWRVSARYGFMESPGVPTSRRCSRSARRSARRRASWPDPWKRAITWDTNVSGPRDRPTWPEGGSACSC